MTKAIIHTSEGDIKVDLFDDKAPFTVSNFVKLATGKQQWTDPVTGEPTTEPLYNGTVFHRIIKDFMIQGGDPAGNGTGGPGYMFDDEIDPELTFDKPYLLAMANAGKHRDPATGEIRGTNGSQFFITTVNTSWRNGKHTIFGEVTDEESQKIVKKIESVETDRSDAPVEPVMIETIEILN